MARTERARKRRPGRYYEENRGEILADIEKLGKGEAIRKWAIPLSTWRRLRKRWNGHCERAGISGNGNNGHRTEERPALGPAVSLAAATANGSVDVFRGRLAELIRKVAEAEESSEWARGMRLAARLVEVA